MTEWLTLSCPLSSLEADAYGSACNWWKLLPVLLWLGLSLAHRFRRYLYTQLPLGGTSLNPYCRYFSALVLNPAAFSATPQGDWRNCWIQRTREDPGNQRSPGKLNVMTSFTPSSNSTAHEAVIIRESHKASLFVTTYLAKGRRWEIKMLLLSACFLSHLPSSSFCPSRQQRRGFYHTTHSLSSPL